MALDMNIIRQIFFKNIIGEINLYNLISFILKFFIVFIVLYFIYMIVKLIILDIRNIDYSIKKKVAYIIVKDNNKEETRYRLEAVNKIGRSITNDIVLNSNLVSKEHADIIESDGSYFIIDKNSSNGTFVNGQIVDSNIELLNGDIIEIGDYKIEFIEEIISESVSEDEDE